MTAHARISIVGKPGGARTAVKHPAKARGMFVQEWAMTESLEDARLNAIADERSSGPFVQVSLNDL